VAQKLSRLPATDGKETSRGDGSLSLRQLRLEGLGGPDAVLARLPYPRGLGIA